MDIAQFTPERRIMTITGTCHLRYRATDDSGETIYFRAADDDDARARTRNWMSGADFDTSEGTVYYHADIYQILTDADFVETEEYIGREDMSFDPPEPDCVHGEEHAWRSPHSRGHGGGVIIRECCAHCGRYKVTDTWAQDRSTGEWGLRSETYEDADEASLKWVTRRKVEAMLDGLDSVHCYDTTADGYMVTLTDTAIRRGEFNPEDDEQRDEAWDCARDAAKTLERAAPELPDGVTLSFDLDDEMDVVVKITI